MTACYILAQPFKPYDFLAAIARFPKLERIRIHFRFDYVYHCHLDEFKHLPHFQKDPLTVRHMYSYIRNRRRGQPFRLKVVMGHDPRSFPNFGTRVSFDLLTRPIVQFICFDDERGNVVIQHDAHKHDYSGWEENDSDETRLQKTPGITYPSNLEVLIAAEREFDQTMERFGKDTSDDEVTRLFGSP
jgi:hypothetical protein